MNLEPFSFHVNWKQDMFCKTNHLSLSIYEEKHQIGTTCLCLCHLGFVSHENFSQKFPLSFQLSTTGRLVKNLKDCDDDDDLDSHALSETKEKKYWFFFSGPKHEIGRLLALSCFPHEIIMVCVYIHFDCQVTVLAISKPSHFPMSAQFKFLFFFFWFWG